VKLPVILRPAAEADVRQICEDLEAARVGLSLQFINRLRQVLLRIEANPEMYGVVWRDVRAARLRKFRHVVYYVTFADRVEVLAVMHGARDAGNWKTRV